MISITNVTKQYKGSSRPALSNVTLEIEKGDFVFLVGASGSGKSSLLRLMLREDVPSTGSVHVLGENLVGIPSRRIPFFRRKLGVVAAPGAARVRAQENTAGRVRMEAVDQRLAVLALRRLGEELLGRLHPELRRPVLR